jgi:hypothetical protein
MNNQTPLSYAASTTEVIEAPEPSAYGRPAGTMRAYVSRWLTAIGTKIARVPAFRRAEIASVV